MDEDWRILSGFFPADWKILAERTGALKGLRKDKSPENLLRVLLMHVGCGHSLRETVVRAREAGLAELSDVALMKRLRKSRDWLHHMCVALFEDSGVSLSGAEGGPQVRVFDATTVKEPGRTGSLWRIHYSVGLPSLACDHFKVTGTSGPGSAECLSQFPIRAGDLVLADRGYAKGPGIAHVLDAGGHVTVRVNTGSLKLSRPGGGRFDLMGAVRSLESPGAVASWPLAVADGDRLIGGRLCALRKSGAAVRLAHRRLRRDASKRCSTPKPETFEYAKYIMLFTTFPRAGFDDADIMEWYRLRWQVELVFKRFKSLARLGHLPKHDDESARAWLYGKLLTALLTEKLIAHARAISPWGYELAPPAAVQPVE